MTIEQFKMICEKVKNSIYERTKDHYHMSFSRMTAYRMKMLLKNKNYDINNVRSELKEYFDDIEAVIVTELATAYIKGITDRILANGLSADDTDKTIEKILKVE